MSYWGKRLRRHVGILLTLVLAFYCPFIAQAAEGPTPAAQPAVQMNLTKQATDPNSLTVDGALSLALDNHPNVKAARERIGAQEAVLGQQMGGYYPTITFNNIYRTTIQAGTTGTAANAFDFFSSLASFNMTLYNFGKREGTVQAARAVLPGAVGRPSAR